VASELEDGAAAAAIAHRVQQALCKPFALQGGARRIDCSIGVTMLSDDKPEADRVRANAEIALTEAQGAGPGNVRYFRESLRTEAEQREILFAELLGGLERGELVPFFQPQIDIATGAFTGFEALVRWMHPRRGLLTPAAFLDFAEAADLTERIGEVVLDRSLQALLEWDAAGFHVPKVGVNFALAQLRDPRLIEKIKWEVERQDIDPGRLAIEVLETVLIKSDTDLVVRNLRGLASAGFEIELDDFGTGHASIQNLRRFMVNRIKIDRSFIFGIESSEEQQTLTASMIAMARALGIRTLAEGVETAEAEAVLRDLGCDQLQGYLIAKPMSFADTFGWLEKHSRRERGGACAEAATGGDPNIP
jgi:EAL domain-containing protein (putative c-di-GMP-specific phosphodiesterase class I)